MVLQGALGRGCEFFIAAASFGLLFAQKMIRQGQNVIFALTQGGDLQENDIQAKKQILPKATCSGILFQVAVACG